MSVLRLRVLALSCGLSLGAASGQGAEIGSSAPVSTAPVSTAPVSTAPVSTAPVSTAPERSFALELEQRAEAQSWLAALQPAPGTQLEKVEAEFDGPAGRVVLRPRRIEGGAWAVWLSADSLAPGRFGSGGEGTSVLDGTIRWRGVVRSGSAARAELPLPAVSLAARRFGVDEQLLGQVRYREFDTEIALPVTVTPDALIRNLSGTEVLRGVGSTPLVVVGSYGASVEVWVEHEDGERSEVTERQVGVRTDDAENGQTRREYLGVPLRAGRNVIVVREAATAREQRLVTELAGPAVQARARVVRALADGVSAVELRLTVEDDHARRAVLPSVTVLSADSGLRDEDALQPGVQLALRDGQASLRLPATIRSGQHELLLLVNGHEQRLTYEVSPAQRRMALIDVQAGLGADPAVGGSGGATGRASATFAAPVAGGQLDVNFSTDPQVGGAHRAPTTTREGFDTLGDQARVRAPLESAGPLAARFVHPDVEIEYALGAALDPVVERPAAGDALHVKTRDLDAGPAAVWLEGSFALQAGADRRLVPEVLGARLLRLPAGTDAGLSQLLRWSGDQFDLLVPGIDYVIEDQLIILAAPFSPVDSQGRPVHFELVVPGSGDSDPQAVLAARTRWSAPGERTSVDVALSTRPAVADSAAPTPGAAGRLSALGASVSHEAQSAGLSFSVRARALVVRGQLAGEGAAEPSFGSGAEASLRYQRRAHTPAGDAQPAATAGFGAGALRAGDLDVSASVVSASDVQGLMSEGRRAQLGVEYGLSERWRLHAAAQATDDTRWVETGLRFERPHLSGAAATTSSQRADQLGSDQLGSGVRLTWADGLLRPSLYAEAARRTPDFEGSARLDVQPSSARLEARASVPLTAAVRAGAVVSATSGDSAQLGVRFGLEGSGAAQWRAYSEWGGRQPAALGATVATTRALRVGQPSGVSLDLGLSGFMTLSAASRLGGSASLRLAAPDSVRPGQGTQAELAMDLGLGHAPEWTVRGRYQRFWDERSLRAEGLSSLTRSEQSWSWSHRYALAYVRREEAALTAAQFSWRSGPVSAPQGAALDLHLARTVWSPDRQARVWLDVHADPGDLQGLELQSGALWGLWRSDRQALPGVSGSPDLPAGFGVNLRAEGRWQPLTQQGALLMGAEARLSPLPGLEVALGVAPLRLSYAQVWELKSPATYLRLNLAGFGASANAAGSPQVSSQVSSQVRP